MKKSKIIILLSISFILLILVSIFFVLDKNIINVLSYKLRSQNYAIRELPFSNEQKTFDNKELARIYLEEKIDSISELKLIKEDSESFEYQVIIDYENKYESTRKVEYIFVFKKINGKYKLIEHWSAVLCEENGNQKWETGYYCIPDEKELRGKI